jgi:hypothetical protein
MENASVADCVRLLGIARDELLNSQSARRSTGLLAFDEQRTRAIVDKLESLLENYISAVQPLDLPESTPGTPMTGLGKVGI